MSLCSTGNGFINCVNIISVTVSSNLIAHSRKCQHKVLTMTVLVSYHDTFLGNSCSPNDTNKVIDVVLRQLQFGIRAESCAEAECRQQVAIVNKSGMFTNHR